RGKNGKGKKEGNPTEDLQMNAAKTIPVSPFKAMIFAVWILLHLLQQFDGMFQIIALIFALEQVHIGDIEKVIGFLCALSCCLCILFSEKGFCLSVILCQPFLLLSLDGLLGLRFGLCLCM